MDRLGWGFIREEDRREIRRRAREGYNREMLGRMDRETVQNGRRMYRSIMSRPIQVESHVFNVTPTYRNPFTELRIAGFLSPFGRVNPNLIREFYVGYNYDMNRRISFQMNDEEYEWSLDEFGRVIGAPATGTGGSTYSTDLWNIPGVVGVQSVVYSICKMPIPHIRRGEPVIVRDENIKTSLVSQNEIIKRNIFFREESVNELSCAEAVLLWGLVTRTPINVAELIANRMSDLGREVRRPLPYATLLNRIFYEIGVLGRAQGSEEIGTSPILASEEQDDFM